MNHTSYPNKGLPVALRNDLTLHKRFILIATPLPKCREVNSAYYVGIKLVVEKGKNELPRSRDYEVSPIARYARSKRNAAETAGNQPSGIEGRLP